MDDIGYTIVVLDSQGLPTFALPTQTDIGVSLATLNYLRDGINKINEDLNTHFSLEMMVTG